jgi:hypothetical protein
MTDNVKAFIWVEHNSKSQGLSFAFNLDFFNRILAILMDLNNGPLFFCRFFVSCIFGQD